MQKSSKSILLKSLNSLKNILNNILKNSKWLITGIIFLTMIFCLLSKKELFPFAPYTMYANRYSPENYQEVQVFYENSASDFVEITEHSGNIIKPFDEARLKTSIQNFYNRSDVKENKINEVKKVCKELAHLISLNLESPRKSIRVRISNYKTLQDLRDKKLNLIEQIDVTEN
jgi:hypothetical protein